MSPPRDLETLTTEAADPRFRRIDEMSVAELAAVMNEADRTVPDAVRAALPQIVPALEAASERMGRGGRLVYVGAGTPGRLGVLDASECPPTFSTPPGQVFAIIAGGARAIAHAVEGAEDDAAAGVAEIDAARIGPDDTVIGLSASGRTPFVVAAVERARERGALTVGLACNADTALGEAAEHRVEVLVGPEVISGSTRLKSGTAQKLVLNMFSTVLMVQLGKTYGNLMVDVRAGNEKLRQRAVHMVARIADVPAAEAYAALTTVDFNVKLAVIRIVCGLDTDAARAALQAAGGRLRRVLEGDR